MSPATLRAFLLDKLNRTEVVPLVTSVIENATPERNCVVACLNPHSVVTAGSVPVFQDALSQADVLLADGAGIILSLHMLHAPAAPRITGQDFFLEVLRQAAYQAMCWRGRKVRFFFFGSSEQVLRFIRSRMEREWPSIEICGMISPPFSDWTDEMNADFVSQINEARPDFLWVGMTAPKQEMWVHRNRSRLAVPVIASIGAVFDFYAGTYKRAPEWACRLGIEWLFRLIKEPRRMWRRNCVSTPWFLWLSLQAQVAALLKR